MGMTALLSNGRDGFTGRALVSTCELRFPGISRCENYWHAVTAKSLAAHAEMARLKSAWLFRVAGAGRAAFRIAEQTERQD